MIAVVVINTDERAGKGECFTISDKKGRVDDTNRWECDSCYEQCASEDAHCRSNKQLKI